MNLDPENPDNIDFCKGCGCEISAGSIVCDDCIFDDEFSHLRLADPDDDVDEQGGDQ